MLRPCGWSRCAWCPCVWLHLRALTLRLFPGFHGCRVPEQPMGQVKLEPLSDSGHLGRTELGLDD